MTVCPWPCKFGHTLGHYHCPFCDDQFRSKHDFKKHCNQCSATEEENSNIQLSVNQDDFEENGSHYSKTQIKQESSEAFVENFPSIELADPAPAEFSCKSEVSPVVSARISDSVSPEQENWEAPKTYIRETSNVLQEYELKRCKGCQFCGVRKTSTNVHCPICPTSRFKPNRMDKVVSHLMGHFSGNRGYVKSRGEYRFSYSPAHTCFCIMYV